MALDRITPEKPLNDAAAEAAGRGHVLAFQRGRVVETSRKRCWQCLRLLINGLCPKCSRPAA